MFNKATLPETNKAAENGWLEVERRSIPFWMACFQVLTLVSGRVPHKFVSFLFVSNWEHMGTPQALETFEIQIFPYQNPSISWMYSKFSKP